MEQYTVNATISFVFEAEGEKEAIKMAKEELNDYLGGHRMPLDDTDFAWSAE